MGCRPSGLQGCRWWQRQGGASLSVPSDLKPKPESKEGGRNQHTDVRPLPGSPGARHTSNPRDQSPGGSCPPSARADPRGQPALGGHSTGHPVRMEVGSQSPSTRRRGRPPGSLRAGGRSEGGGLYIHWAPLLLSTRVSCMCGTAGQGWGHEYLPSS